MQQILKNDGFKTEIVTVDRVQKDTVGRPVCLPYYFLKNMIYSKQLTIFDKCNQLTTELIDLERKGDGHINHPKTGGKDSADALCGSLWLASKYSEEFSYSYGDALAASLQANETTSEGLDYKHNLLTAFEQELSNLDFKSFDTKIDSGMSYQEDSDDFDGIFIL